MPAEERTERLGESVEEAAVREAKEETGLDVRLVDDPLSCVARGTAVSLDNLSLWKETMESDADDM